jgi:hypothetical protein
MKYGKETTFLFDFKGLEKDKKGCFQQARLSKIAGLVIIIN